jgi:hypothetical protein
MPIGLKVFLFYNRLGNLALKLHVQISAKSLKEQKIADYALFFIGKLQFFQGNTV